MKTRISNFFFKIIDAWWVDYLLGVVVFFVGSQFIPRNSSLDILGSVNLDRRLSLYTDLITISTLLAGFLGLAFTSYLGWSSKNIEDVQRQAGNHLLRIWLVGIGTPWACALLIWLAKIHDQGNYHSGNLSRWIVLASLVPLIMSFTRIVYLYFLLAGAELHSSKPTVGVSKKRLSTPL